MYSKKTFPLILAVGVLAGLLITSTILTPNKALAKHHLKFQKNDKDESASAAASAAAAGGSASAAASAAAAAGGSAAASSSSAAAIG